MNKCKTMKAAWMVGVGACVAGTAAAEQYAFVGARANGMGGANAASVRDATAQWHNPAAFGFFGRSEWATNAADNGNLSAQTFSWEILGLGAGYTLTEDMGRYLDILADIDFDAFDQGTLSAASENVNSLLSMAGIVGNLDSGDALYADASAGTAMQIGHFGIGVRLFGEAAAWALPDLTALSLDSYPDVAALVSEFNSASANEGFAWGGSYILTPEQRNNLATSLGNIDPNGDTIKYLDAKLGDLVASGDLTGAEIGQAVDLFNNLVPGAGGVIGSNQTAVVGRGFALVEIPFSYGWALNENLSFGVTAKAMYGSVLGTKIWIFNEDNDQILEEAGDNREETLAFGLDLGALYRINNFQFALTGHNLNRPTFDGFSNTVDLNGTPVPLDIPDVEVDPQVTIGAAFMPTKRFTLEADYELLETGTLLPDYDIQRLSFGTELDLTLLALRLGAYRNLAADWQDWVATAGVGLNLFGFRIDVGGAYSLEGNVDYEGTEIPAEARLYASLGLDF